MWVACLYFYDLGFRQEKCEYNKGVIRSRKSKERQNNGQEKSTKGKTMIYRTLHRQLKIK